MASTKKETTTNPIFDDKGTTKVFSKKENKERAKSQLGVFHERMGLGSINLFGTKKKMMKKLPWFNVQCIVLGTKVLEAVNGNEYVTAYANSNNGPVAIGLLFATKNATIEQVLEYKDQGTLNFSMSQGFNTSPVEGVEIV